MRKLGFIILLCTAFLPLSAQFQTKIMQDNIKTLRVRYLSQADQPSNKQHPVRPVLYLNGGIVDNSDPENILEFSFDELSQESHQYTFTLLHLNADMTESSLMSSEYLRGFTTKDITDYEYSHNTAIEYTHYTFTIPNEDMTLTASGNYVVKVYEDGDPDKIVFFKTFFVVDPQVAISYNLIANTDIEFSGRFQQLDIDINTTLVQSRQQSSADLSQDYFIVVRQNGRTDNMVFRPKPNYISTNRLQFKHNKELIFEGGNEYRHFDIFSNYMAGTNVYKIEFRSGDYHALLETDIPRGVGSMYAGDVVTQKIGAPYMHEYDHNGQFVINAERALHSPEIEAEYMWVHWLLPSQPYFDGSVYILGDLFDNRFGPSNRLIYDAENKCYYLYALVKQGGYDYSYAFLPKTPEADPYNTGYITKGATLQKIEGSHWETENEYTIYVYYRPFGARYDQLVGYTSSSE